MLRCYPFSLRWLGPLKELIEGVSKKFAKFFMEMGCNGEVGLQESDVSLSVCICSTRSLLSECRPLWGKCERGSCVQEYTSSHPAHSLVISEDVPGFSSFHFPSIVHAALCGEDNS